MKVLNDTGLKLIRTWYKMATNSMTKTVYPGYVIESGDPRGFAGALLGFQDISVHEGLYK
jgi:hypothetical protein